ncbi:hypothetical protein A2Z67_04005 [Candidatus Woesebacteria bacterium RBG_13_36_22]|uniref:Uncharacterized protein n=1 Tax=Candidatus Woesebacteria bacterium RBG_13_36_22 TaxID=1802478 RepID=A0A1F7X4P0_9BACT|nr:MAG: hypothetical protein A2Z67_04005 [Candidatus Woesebacteria bacterium RBG_13_36_22]
MSKLKKRVITVLIVIGIIIAIVIIVQIINASKYKMVVNVVEGENVMGVNPLTESLDFGDLSRNNGMTRYVSMENNGKLSSFVVVWKFGAISSLINLDKNFFTLKSGEENKLSFEIKIPPSAETKQYKGWVWIFRLPIFW